MRLAGQLRPARLLLLLLFGLALAVGPAACSSGDGGTSPDAGQLAPLVGTWEATRMVVTSLDAPDTEVDLIAQGASFTLEIRDSGRYTATLTAFDRPEVEEGTLEVSGSTIVFDPDGEDPRREGTWSLSAGTLEIDAPTSFDFNLDGTAESADLHLELVRG